MTPQQLPFDRGFYWIKEGFALFMRSPLLWLVLLFVSLLGALLLVSIPLLGEPLVTVLTPAVVAGLMIGCQDLYKNEELEVKHLLAGFQHNASQLITLGGITMAGQYLIMGLMKGLGAGELVALMNSDTPIKDPEQLRLIIDQSGPAIIIGTTLFFTLMMCIQFAPMLVRLQNVHPLQAMYLSFMAFIVNVKPMLAYSGLFMALGILATLPMMLGWLLLGPLIFTSLYVAYTDIFPATAQATDSADQTS